MSKRIQLRRGTTAETSTFTGANGEVTVDTTKNTLVVHDGVTAGGHPLMNEMSFGVGNNRLDVTSSRIKETTYTNTSGTLKIISINCFLQAGGFLKLLEGSTEIGYIGIPNNSTAFNNTLYGIILPNRTYKVTSSGASASISKWVESI